MKKIFVLLLAVMAVMSASAQTKLTLGGQSANGNWSWGTTKTMGADVAINFSSQWGEFTLASAPGDATGCKLVVAEPNAKVNLVVKYADGTDTQYIGVDATEKEITFPTAASNIELQATEAGAELEVKSFVLVGADGTETQTSYSEVWGVATYGGIYTATSLWAQVMLNGAEQDDAQIIKFHCNAPVPAGLQLKVLYTEGGEGYLQLPEGETDPAIEIDNAVKEVSLQFTATDLTIDIAYVTTEPVPTVSDVTFDFTSAESIEALGFTAPEAGAGTEIGTTPIVSGGVTITPTAEGTTPTRFWQSTGKNGGYDLRVYTDAVLTFSAPEGKVITSIVCEDNNKWSEPTPSTGAFDGKTWTGSANSVDWTFNGQCRFKTITVTYGDAKTYTLDFYVEGADEMCDEWAVQVGDQKLEYPYDNDEPYTFAEGSKVYVGGICLDQIHTMVVTVNGEELENEGEYGANLFTFDLTQNTVIKIAFKQNYTLNFSADYDEMCDEWGVYADGQKLEYPYDNDNPYTFVEGTQISVGGICIDALHEMVVTVNDEVVPADAFDPDTRVYTFTLSQDTNIKIQFKDPAVAVATYAQTEDSAEPAVAVQFLDHTTCFFDKYKYNNVDVTLVDANGTSYDIVRTEDNYQLADYSCDVTSFILGAELPAGNYTLTIPAGAMVVDDASNYYTFNANDYVIDFTVTDAAPAKLINKGNVNAINNVNVADDNAPVYNIAGQRVSNAQKGIFIQNGKKFFNK